MCIYIYIDTHDLNEKKSYHINMTLNASWSPECRVQNCCKRILKLSPIHCNPVTEWKSGVPLPRPECLRVPILQILPIFTSPFHGKNHQKQSGHFSQGELGIGAGQNSEKRLELSWSVRNDWLTMEVGLPHRSAIWHNLTTSKPWPEGYANYRKPAPNWRNLRDFEVLSTVFRPTNPFKNIDRATFLEVAGCLRCLCLASLKFLPWTWRLGHKTDWPWGYTDNTDDGSGSGTWMCIPFKKWFITHILYYIPIFHPIYQWGYSIYIWGITHLRFVGCTTKIHGEWMVHGFTTDLRVAVDPNVEATAIHLGNSHLTSQKIMLPHKMYAIKLKTYSQSIFTIISGEVLCCQYKLFKYIHI